MDEVPDKPKSHGRLKVQVTAVPRDLMEEPRHIKGAWVVRIVTLFPEAFPGTLGLSLTGKALDQGLWRLEPLGRDRTRVVYENRASSPLSAPALVTRAAMRRDVARALKALKRESESRR